MCRDTQDREDGNETLFAAQDFYFRLGTQAVRSRARCVPAEIQCRNTPTEIVLSCPSAQVLCELARYVFRHKTPLFAVRGRVRERRCPLWTRLATLSTLGIRFASVYEDITTADIKLVVDSTRSRTRELR